ncbi:hypothetical protein PAHAL_5G166900 [Panicum hallii]|jgi:hypothetical protein|uniref:Uncharacterized protein n=1 Tax=Panicum hallii TaxID=206008 RepID=A0A2S3HRW7_9POAL|nr:hypothetical protein PAHAL_5G166900 [Panicum hallii]
MDDTIGCNYRLTGYLRWLLGARRACAALHGRHHSSSPRRPHACSNISVPFCCLGIAFKFVELEYVVKALLLGSSLFAFSSPSSF